MTAAEKVAVTVRRALEIAAWTLPANELTEEINKVEIRGRGRKRWNLKMEETRKRGFIGRATNAVTGMLRRKPAEVDAEGEADPEDAPTPEEIARFRWVYHGFVDGLCDGALGEPRLDDRGRPVLPDHVKRLSKAYQDVYSKGYLAGLEESEQMDADNAAGTAKATGSTETPTSRSEA